MTDEARLNKLQQLFEHYLRDPETRRAYLGDRANAFRADEDLSRLARGVAERAVSQGLGDARIDELSVPELRAERNYSEATASFLEHAATTESIRFAAQLPAEPAPAQPAMADGMFDIRPTRDNNLSAPTGAVSAPIAEVRPAATATLDEDPAQDGLEETQDAENATSHDGALDFRGLFGAVSPEETAILNSGTSKFKLPVDDRALRVITAAFPGMLQSPAFLQEANVEWNAHNAALKAEWESTPEAEREGDEAPSLTVHEWLAQAKQDPAQVAKLQKKFKETCLFLPNEMDGIQSGFTSYKVDYKGTAGKVTNKKCIIFSDPRGNEYLFDGKSCSVRLAEAQVTKEGTIPAEQFGPQHALNVIAPLVQMRAGELDAGGFPKPYKIALSAGGLFDRDKVVQMMIMATLMQADRSGSMASLTIEKEKGLPMFKTRIALDKITEGMVSPEVMRMFPGSADLIEKYNSRRNITPTATSESEADATIGNQERAPARGPAVHVQRPAVRL